MRKVLNMAVRLDGSAPATNFQFQFSSHFAVAHRISFSSPFCREGRFNVECGGKRLLLTRIFFR
jgi:hypothetical protein